MNGKDIFRDLKKGYKPNRNGFDLENRHIFSVKACQKLPIFHEETVPGGTYKVNPVSIMQSINPLQTKAYVRLRQSLDFYFFPYNYSNTLFNQMIAGRKDNTLRTQIGHPLEVARFCLFDFLVELLCHHGATYYLATDGLNKAISTSPDANKIMADFWHLDISPSTYLLTGVIRNLDLMGYGNYLPLLKLVESYMKDEFNPSEPDYQYDTIYTELRTFNYQVVDFCTELLFMTTNLAHYKLPYDSTDPLQYLVDRNNYDMKYYNLFVPAAYNRCYHAFSRNEYFTENLTLTSPSFVHVHTNNVVDFAELFNFDGITDMDMNNYFALLCVIFAVKPAPRFKDMFTGVLPDSQFGDISVMMDDRSWLNLEVDDSVNDIATVSTCSTGNPGSRALSYAASIIPTSSPKFRFNPALAISVLEQRRANALQIFRERQMRAGNRTSDNFNAHFGVSPYSNTDMLPTYLGSFDGDVVLNDVTNLADTEFSPLGSRASYANGTLVGNQITLEAKDFGVIIGILSIVPYEDYNSFMIDKCHSKLEQFDFFFPEFDDLGLQAASFDDFSVFSFDGQSLSFSDIRGFLFRYYEHKLSVDKVHGELYAGFNPRRVLQARDLNAFLNSHVDSISSGVFSHYASARPSLDPTDESFLYCQIEDLDSIFYQSADNTQITDQFMYNINFNAPAIQPMSVRRRAQLAQV